MYHRVLQTVISHYADALRDILPGMLQRLGRGNYESRCMVGYVLKLAHRISILSGAATLAQTHFKESISMQAQILVLLR